LVIVIVLVMIGLIPDIFLTWMTDILTAFPQLQ
jgi:hypothetical protein